MDTSATRSRVEALLKQLLGAEQLVADGAGNWPVRWGSAVYFVRLVEPPLGPPVVQVFSPLLGHVPKTPALLDALNNLNVQATFARFAWAGDAVMVGCELMADTIDPPELQAVCQTIASLADTYDDALQQQFGGQIWLAGGAEAGGFQPVGGVPSGGGDAAVTAAMRTSEYQAQSAWAERVFSPW